MKDLGLYVHIPPLVKLGNWPISFFQCPKMVAFSRKMQPKWRVPLTNDCKNNRNGACLRISTIWLHWFQPRLHFATKNAATLVEMQPESESESESEFIYSQIWLKCSQISAAAVPFRFKFGPFREQQQQQQKQQQQQQQR